MSISSHSMHDLNSLIKSYYIQDAYLSFMNYLYNGCKGVKIKETIHDTYAGTELKGGSKVCTQHNFS